VADLKDKPSVADLRWRT